MKLPFGKRPTEDDRTIEFVWGGIYTYLSPEDKKYHLFKVLSMADGAMHESLYQETFDEVPSAEQVEQLRPFVMHAPIAPESWLDDKNLTLVARTQLTRQALEGYGEYLRQTTGATEAELDEFYDSVIAWSGRSVWLRLSKKNGISVVE